MNPLLAAIDGSTLVWQLVFVLVIGICCLLIWWVGKWFIGTLGAPPLAMTIWNGLFLLLGLIVAINFLLSLVGKPFIAWKP